MKKRLKIIDKILPKISDDDFFGYFYFFKALFLYSVISGVIIMILIGFLKLLKL